MLQAWLYCLRFFFSKFILIYICSGSFLQVWKLKDSSLFFVLLVQFSSTGFWMPQNHCFSYTHPPQIRNRVRPFFFFFFYTVLHLRPYILILPPFIPFIFTPKIYMYYLTFQNSYQKRSDSNYNVYINRFRVGLIICNLIKKLSYIHFPLLFIYLNMNESINWSLLILLVTAAHYVLQVPFSKAEHTTFIFVLCLAFSQGVGVNWILLHAHANNINKISKNVPNIQMQIQKSSAFIQV